MVEGGAALAAAVNDPMTRRWQSWCVALQACPLCALVIPRSMASCISSDLGEGHKERNTHLRGVLRAHDGCRGAGDLHGPEPHELNYETSPPVLLFKIKSHYPLHLQQIYLSRTPQ